MDPAFFKPEDIGTQHCAGCGSDIEFWKDDVFLDCSRCGAGNTNARLRNTCLTWCKEASACIGNTDIDEWLTLNRKGWKVGQTELQI